MSALVPDLLLRGCWTLRRNGVHDAKRVGGEESSTRNIDRVGRKGESAAKPRLKMATLYM